MWQTEQKPNLLLPFFLPFFTLSSFCLSHHHHHIAPGSALPIKSPTTLSLFQHSSQLHHLLTIVGFVASKHVNENNRASGLYRREPPCLFAVHAMTSSCQVTTGDVCCYHVRTKCCSFCFLFQIPMGTGSNRWAAYSVTHTLSSLVLRLAFAARSPAHSQSGAKIKSQWESATLVNFGS